MKKIFSVIAIVLFFGAAQHFYAQNKATTPAKNSPVRKVIFAVVEKKFPKIKKENVFLVQGNWARVVYDLTDDGAADANVILKNTGNIWKIVYDFNAGNEEGDDVDDYVKEIPAKIKNPWSN